ncbi:MULTISPECIES: hypothetical protein [Sulfitobacter]|uniref:hypothetical protein n=1 Tax=Sulfitobacter TaxID=60136 RepID=UPI002307C124|nr:hypothetical protein [Sulfitobacter faviae]WCE68595.1 hypothetical protein PL335_17285 [Sulfitobacter faviae]
MKTLFLSTAALVAFAGVASAQAVVDAAPNSNANSSSTTSALFNTATDEAAATLTGESALAALDVNIGLVGYGIARAEVGDAIGAEAEARDGFFGGVSDAGAPSQSENAAVQFQVGNDNVSFNTQVGNFQETATVQVGDNNQAWTSQSGDANEAAIAQSGDGNKTALLQEATDHAAAAAAFGNNNQAIGYQYGGTNNALAMAQQGDNNSIAVLQNGSDNTAASLQLGNDNGSFISQGGSDSISVQPFEGATQSGPTFTETVAGLGLSVGGSFTNGGNGNAAASLQVGNSNANAIVQSGNNNTAVNYQNSL